MMNLSALSQIEERIAQLSLAEQLWLIERVAQRLREHLDAQSAFDQQLAVMAADQEMQQELRRIEKETTQEYQTYLSGRGARIYPLVKEFVGERPLSTMGEVEVRLIEYDLEGQEKVITGILFAAAGNHISWNEILERVRRMSEEEKRRVLAQYLGGRTARWQKIGRAFENVSMRFEIVMDIGAWRDLHRHRILTQMRQDFTCAHGYHVPSEVSGAGLEGEFRNAIDRAEEIFLKIQRRNPYVAQYAVTLAHRIRFMQLQNLRSLFWETELRTIPEGHPDYRKIEQEKFRLIEKAYPLVAEHMLVNLEEYDFARRGQEEKIQKKIQQLFETPTSAVPKPEGG